MIKVFLFSKNKFHTYRVKHYVKCSKCVSMGFVDGNISVILREFQTFSGKKFPEVLFSYVFIFFRKNTRIFYHSK